ncbi:MAG TPA: amino acid adenylation domain-containing protein [Williamwhitmania sp.]|nr:amino acid adenylation domain-containing protein [Williamwhitmania sp.]
MQKNLIEYFDRVQKLHPNRAAVIEGDKSISFSQLGQDSKNVANRIIVAVEQVLNKPVAVFLPKGIESVVADLAITYSGNVYMNLDVKSPQLRIENILNLIQPVLILTNNANRERLSGISYKCTILCIDDIEASSSGDELIYRRLEAHIDTDPYCIINTSGSTGTPKGVVLNHRSFIDFTEWAIDTLHIKDNEIVGSLSPIVFDIYSFELCMLMAKGSTLVVLPDSLAAFPAKLLSIMQEQKVTFIFWVPTIMVNIANMDLLSKIALPVLKTVWFAGEVFPTKQFNQWKQQLPSTKFVNLYGPIEITLDCTYYVVERELKDNEPIPIGFPCKNSDVLILNESNQRVAIGEEGELCVRGSSLAMGYYNNPVKTAEAFVQNPLNSSYPEIIYRTGDIVSINERGEIEFKGRKDSLIKHMGYRIELGEIEHVIINTLKLVENGCVVYNFSKKEITLFFEAKGEISLAELKSKIATVFPKYMIPTVYMRLEEMPRNINGKIDRLFLNNSINNG